RVPWDQYVGDVNVVTGNFTPSFTDLSVAGLGVTTDFQRTHNSQGTGIRRRTRPLRVLAHRRLEPLPAVDVVRPRDLFPAAAGEHGEEITPGALPSTTTASGR
ncbi:MAG: hypothetical protein M0Z27_10115, partial [Thermaerobacter sp.]|nr:hypothetical protein [Thermaerobacter sp.]